jgi:outer membrane protein assembly factor BamA
MMGMTILLSACSTTRYVPEGSYLLSNVKLDVEGSDAVGLNISQLRSRVRQNPNARLFSLFKMPLATYSLSGRDSTLWVNRLLRSMGEPPVVFDSMMAMRTCADLRQELRNEGYLRAEVKHSVKTRGKKAKVTYHLMPGKPFFINDIFYQVDDPQLLDLMARTDDASHRLLTKGMKFDVSILDAERKRLTNLMNDNGFYRFHKEFISYVADTVEGSRMIDVTLHVGLYKRSGIADTLHSQYAIDKIRYVSGDPDDNRLHLRRHVLEECTHLEEGENYSGTKLQQTYNHFGRMQAVKYTNISIVQHPDTTLLDCNITLQTNKPSTISFQPEGTNTAGDLGAAASLTYQNRNLFRGSELLSIELRGAYEAIKGLEGYSNQDFTEYSVEARLAFPRFLLPWVYHKTRRKAQATSEVSLLYDMQDRPEFHRRVLSAAWRYKWNFPHRHDRFQLDLLDLNYVFMPWISDTFRREYLESENSRNAILRYNYEDLFITKIGLGYAYSNNYMAVKTNIETSGNILSLGSMALNTNKDDRGQYRLFNIAFAQYVKGDLDLTRSLQLDRHNQLVFHLGLGIAYPYGNSTVLPFEKRYFSGGANSVRGWSVRSLGPGKFKEHDGRINFINQTGDMKLDLNAEYRTHLFWKLGGALFVDAGNIWTLRDYEEQPGGQFKVNEFLSQLAVGYGLGFRFNFDYFVLRFDMGMKAINPAFETENDEHYPLLHHRLSRDFAFHFAVGMPF